MGGIVRAIIIEIQAHGEGVPHVHRGRVGNGDRQGSRAAFAHFGGTLQGETGSSILDGQEDRPGSVGLPAFVVHLHLHVPAAVVLDPQIVQRRPIQGKVLALRVTIRPVPVDIPFISLDLTRGRGRNGQCFSFGNHMGTSGINVAPRHGDGVVLAPLAGGRGILVFGDHPDRVLPGPGEDVGEGSYVRPESLRGLECRPNGPIHHPARNRILSRIGYRSCHGPFLSDLGTG